HFTIRSLMHQAALKASCDPDSLSFTGAVRVVCRKIIAAHFPPSGLLRLKEKKLLTKLLSTKWWPGVACAVNAQSSER
ncbi:MAG: hypothetical protein PHV82_12540, partial [Victivallaceae bacterium]|nr:hypothetical protein [Victivallaceae bacterium]